MRWGLSFFLLFGFRLFSQNVFEFNNNLFDNSNSNALSLVYSCGAGVGNYCNHCNINGSPDSYCFNSGEGFLFTNNNYISNEYTISLIFKIDNINGYRRLIDFSNGNLDEGIYNLSSALNFYPNGNILTSAFNSSSLTCLTLTRSNTGIISIYLNGYFVSSYNDIGNIYKPINSFSPIL